MSYRLHGGAGLLGDWWNAAAEMLSPEIFDWERSSGGRVSGQSNWGGVPDPQVFWCPEEDLVFVRAPGLLSGSKIYRHVFNFLHFRLYTPSHTGHSALFPGPLVSIKLQEKKHNFRSCNRNSLLWIRLLWLKESIWVGSLLNSLWDFCRVQARWSWLDQRSIFLNSFRSWCSLKNLWMSSTS